MQAEEQGPPRFLAPGMLDGERLGLPRHSRVEAEREQYREALLASLQAELVEADDLGHHPGLIGEFGKGLAAPLGQRGVETCEGGCRRAVGERSARDET